MKKSRALFKKAKTLMPGGVNSPVRAFGAVGGTPPFIARAKGACLWDADGKAYLDFVGSWGPMLIGHAHPAVTRAIAKTAENGTSFGAPCEAEITLAAMVTRAFPSIDMLRFVSSGTEAVMSAVRAARGFTGRDKIIKFSGGYHGHSDYLLADAGSGAATFGIPASAGVPKDFAKYTLSATYNDAASVEKIFRKSPKGIAALIMEPIAGNMGVIPPKPGFLKKMRSLCTKYGAVLIFDEVISGFRASLGGAQGVYKVKPDLTTLGKIIGGGLPVGCYGGKRAIMENISPLGPVYQAGTLSGNPLAMAAGAATLTVLKKGLKPAKKVGKKKYSNAWAYLEALGAKLEKGLHEAAKENNLPIVINRSGSVLTVFFTDCKKVQNYDDARASDTIQFSNFFNLMLEQGIYLPPSQFEAWFLSTAHSEADINKTLRAAGKAFKSLQKTT